MRVASCQWECSLLVRMPSPIRPSRCSCSSREVERSRERHDCCCPTGVTCGLCAAPQRALAMAMTLPNSPHLRPPRCLLSAWSAFWLMDFRNQLSMAAWFVLRAGYLFLRTAKCHRLCGDSINQSPRIINNQRELERDSNTELCLDPIPVPRLDDSGDDFEKLPIKETAKSSESCSWHQHQFGPCAKNKENFTIAVIAAPPSLLPISLHSPLEFWWITRRIVQWQLSVSVSAANCFVDFPCGALNCPDCWLTRFHLMFSLSRIH